jgi:putative transposase
LVNEIREAYQLSTRVACKICNVSLTAYYYQPKKRQDDAVIKMKLQALAEAHLNWGFSKMKNKLKQEGYKWNHKRLYRVYCELHLNLRKKPKKRLPAREAVALLQPLQSNRCWSLDFMSDALACGRKFRTFNVIDDYNREALLVEPGFSLPAQRITTLLDQLADVRGYPCMVRVDNGPEFISAAFKTWAAKHQIVIHYIQPGKPAQNGFIERFNRTYREEVLSIYWFDDLTEVRTMTNRWMKTYNEERPHESLNNQSPIAFLQTRKNIFMSGKQMAAPQQQLNNSTFTCS